MCNIPTVSMTHHIRMFDLNRSFSWGKITMKAKNAPKGPKANCKFKKIVL